MGVRGLFSFIQSNSDQFMVSHELHSTTIIFDANNLLHHLYNTCSGLNAAFGGNYDKIFAHFNAFCTILDMCKIRPIMVFDGGLDLDDRKKKTRKKRIEYRMRAALSCKPCNHGRLEIFPLFGREVLMEACRQHKFTVVQCDYEADDEMASFSRSMNCPIVSNDSDFVIFGIPLIPLESLSFSPEIIKEGDKEVTSLPCKLFVIDNFLKKFGRLPKTHLPLLGILLGNDYVSAETFQPLWSTISIPKDNRLSDVHRKLKAAMTWLQKADFNLAVQKILETLKPERRKEVRDIIQKNLLVYSHQPKLIDNILKGTEYETEILSYSKKPLPRWFVTAYRKHEFPAWFLEIICMHLLRYLPQVEDRSHPYSAVAAVKVVRGIVAILLTVDHPLIQLEEMEENSSVVVRFATRNGGRMIFEEMLFVEKEITCLPSLVDMPNLGLSTRENFFNKVLNMSASDLKIVEQFPDSVKLFIYSLIHWTRASKPKLEHFDAVLLMMVMFDCVPKKIDRVRSKEKTERLLLSCSQKACKDLSDLNLKELWHSLSSADCLRFNAQILELYQLDKTTIDPKKFDKEIVHSFSELQMIFFLTTILNRLLCHPQPESEMLVEYNGLFAYNAAIFITANKKWMENIERQREAPSVFFLIRKIFDAFFTIRDSLVNTPTIPKKTKKKKNREKCVAEKSASNLESSEEQSEEVDSDDFTENRFAALLKIS